MTIWIDGDACPVAIKEIIFNNCHKRGFACILVANQWMRLPPSPWIKIQVVESGPDVADSYIVTHSVSQDLVITADIPLAYEVVRKGAQAISPRGLEFTANNVADLLSTRDLKDQLRSSGMVGGGPPPLNEKEKQKFAGALDRYLARAKRG